MRPMLWSRVIRAFQVGVVVLCGALLLSSSHELARDEQDRARAYTRSIEFDYLAWMLDAGRVKVQAAAAGIPGYLGRVPSRIVVSDYLQITGKIMRGEEALNRVYADPAFADKEAAASQIRASLQVLNRRSQQLAPLAEGVLQDQVAQVIEHLGLAFFGQSMPPVLYHGTLVPDALIVSPRDEIRQSANISIETDLPLEKQVQLEQRVEQAMNASALVVPIGGVGVYPTMVMQTTDRHWLISTIAHEWTHNYLQLRPLGMLYDHTPELRTMNETVADIMGAEIADEVMRRFYPGTTSADQARADRISSPQRYPDPEDDDPPPFDFRSEMHTTRSTVDTLLASGRIAEAEDYMERRRRTFLAHGYFIRRLNQAYFAFYGAYADMPGGPAGEDPVGPAVRELRTESRSLADFLRRISWMTSFDELQREITRGGR